MRRTKILATVGPATASDEGLAGLLEAGADALRLNFSHGTDTEHRATLRRIHRAERRAGRELAIVADLQGPKLRIGLFAGGSVRLAEGRTWVLDHRPEPGDAGRVAVVLPRLETAARPGDPILLGDGTVELAVESADPARIVTRVVHGGVVGSHAGVFLPNAHLRTAILGRKDRHDLAVALAEGVDYVGLSFVRDATDVVRARRLLDAGGGTEVGIIAKIERAEALGNVEAILEVADGLMVARGDLGIEVPLERLALEQKRLVARANAAAKPVIVATQMLLSMLRAPRPTRAEATDVANAVLDGADALMLSEESAVGPFAREAVRWLDRIARATEGSVLPRPATANPMRPDVAAAGEWAVAGAAVRIAADLGAGAIVTPTHSGRTARLVAAHRPATPVLAVSAVRATRRRLALVWGVAAEPSPAHLPLLELRRLARRAAARRPGMRERPLVLTAGYPVEGRPTNLLTVVDGVDPTRRRAARAGSVRRRGAPARAPR